MRINTDGKKEYRTDLYEETARLLGENNKSAAIDQACLHAKQDLRAKEELVEYLVDRLSATELEHVADILSTDAVTIDVELDTSIEPVE